MTFTATPAAGWYVGGWNDGACVNTGAAATPGVEQECVLTANAHLLVTAIFAVARAVVYGENVSASLAAGGAAVASGDTVADGVTIAFLATPPENHEFAGWTNNGAEVCVGQNPCLLAANADLSARAEFASLLRTIIYAEVPDDQSGGTLTASVPSGGTTLRGLTVTFTAAPAAGWTLAAWAGDGAGCAADGLECALPANRDLFVTVHFAMMTARVEHEILPGDGRGGTVTVAGLAGEDFAYTGAAVTFLALPATGWTLAAWEGDVGSCAAPDLKCGLTADGDLFVTVRFAENCGAKNRAQGGVRSGFAPDNCGGCLDGHGLFGLTRDLCAEAETGDFGDIPQKDVCLKLQGRADAQLEGNGKVCSGVDANDTFCILDSADALPCRGLFRHVLKCNVGWNRRALNPFFCGEVCGAGEKAVGGECLPIPAPIEE